MRSFRNKMMTFAGLPAAFSAWYFALRSGLKRRAKAGHVEGLANIGPAAPDEGAAAPFCRGRRGLRPLVPSSGMSMVSVQAVASEAPYAGQDFAALDSVGIGFHEGKHRLIDIAEFTWICSSHSLLRRLSKASGQGLALVLAAVRSPHGPGADRVDDPPRRDQRAATLFRCSFWPLCNECHKITCRN